MTTHTALAGSTGELERHDDSIAGLHATHRAANLYHVRDAFVPKGNGPAIGTRPDSMPASRSHVATAIGRTIASLGSWFRIRNFVPFELMLGHERELAHYLASSTNASVLMWVFSSGARP